MSNTADVHGAISGFNSFKSLAHYDRMKGILAGAFQAPVTVEIDPVVTCNDGCLFCIAEQFMAKTPPKEKIADADLIVSYLRRFGAWGVKGIVFVGGGEPTLHPRINEMIKAAHETGLEIGMITNGSRLHQPELMQSVIDHVRWIGLSMDAATARTHAVLHTTNDREFPRRLTSMRALSEAGKAVTFKFVLSPWNLDEAADAIEVAASVGCKEIYFRPAYMGTYEQTPALQLKARQAGVDWMYKDMNSFWAKCNDVIDRVEERARVVNAHGHVIDVAISKKKVEDFITNNRSPRCLATPLLCVMSGDNKVHLCCDRREEDFLTLCNYKDEDMLHVWGSERHKAIINMIDVKKCPRCRLEIHNQLMHSIESDAMQVNFI